VSLLVGREVEALERHTRFTDMTELAAYTERRRELRITPTT
jgi:hypothetical protein